MSRDATLIKTGETLHPAGFGVLIEVDPDKEAEVSKGGIHLSTGLGAERERRGSQRGVVVEVGPLACKEQGHSPEHWGAIVGRTVFFTRYQGKYYKTEDGRAFIIMNDTDIDAFLD